MPISLLKSEFLVNLGITPDERLAREFLDLPTRALHYLKCAGGGRILADNDTAWDADKVALGKLLSRAHVAVVVEHLDPNFDKLSINALCGFRYLITSLPQRDKV